MSVSNCDDVRLVAHLKLTLWRDPVRYSNKPGAVDIIVVVSQIERLTTQNGGPEAVGGASNTPAVQSTSGLPSTTTTTASGNGGPQLYGGQIGGVNGGPHMGVYGGLQHAGGYGGL